MSKFSLHKKIILKDTELIIEYLENYINDIILCVEEWVFLNLIEYKLNYLGYMKRLIVEQ